MACEGQEIGRAVAALRQRFLARRPVRTASLIVTLFGDAVVPRGGALTIRALIDLMAGLGIEAGAVRTAMSRLTAEGLFRRTGGGPRPRYGLSAEAERTFAEAFRRVYAGERPAAGSGFSLVVLPAPARKGLDAAGLAAAGYRALAPGVMVAPATAPRVALPEGAYRFAAEADAATVHRVAQEALGLAATAEAYRAFAADFGPVLALVEGGAVPAPAEAFVLRTLAVHAFRRAVIRDPGLPADLLPPDRPDRAARAVIARLYARIAQASEQHLEAVAAADAEPLAPLTLDLARRFSAP